MASGLVTITARSPRPTMWHRRSPRQNRRRDRTRGSGTWASLDHPATRLLDALRTCTPVWAFNCEITTVLFRDDPRLVKVANDVWPYQDDQLGLADRIVFG